MDARRLLQIVQDVKEWRGDVFRLAVLVSTEQRESSARIAEEAGHPDLAAMIRSNNGPDQK